MVIEHKVYAHVGLGNPNDVYLRPHHLSQPRQLLGVCSIASLETLRKTSLVELEAGSMVNLEWAVQPTSRMGGHFVRGHVDEIGEIMSMELDANSLWVKVRAGKELLRYVMPKGFIAVDRTSLTVANVFDGEDCFNFMLVAYTQQKVVIPMKRVEQKVNLEVDILGKYVERLLSSGFVDSMKTSRS